MGGWKISSVRKISSLFRRSKRSSAPGHGSSLNGTPSETVAEPSHASNDIQIATTNSESTAPLADPSGSQLSDTEHVLAFFEERDHTQQIRRAADAVDRRNEEAYLDDLSNYISQYLAFIKKRGEKPSPESAAKCDWPPGSESMIKLKEVISGVADIVKDWCPDAKTMAQKALQGVGELHVVVIGFLVVARTMERFETIKSNKEECVCLFERMNNLIQDVKQLRESPGLEAMEDKIKEAIKLIIEVSLACCTQIDRRKWKKFFSTTVNKKQLQGFQTRLTELHRKIQFQMGFVQLGLLLREPPPPPVASEQWFIY